MPDGSSAPTCAFDAALSLASRGIPVFPCNPATKRPLTPNGFKNATTDPGVISSWWHTWPPAMIGVPTGQVSGCFVLDIDQDEEKGVNGEASLAALAAREGPIPETAEQATPRGGRHLFFAHPGRKVKTTAGMLGPGLDIRGDGGYIVVAPSVNAAGRAYRWVRAPEEMGGLKPRLRR
jgi:Bifunctional DNA primase/polymerase, N-terminal